MQRPSLHVKCVSELHRSKTKCNFNIWGLMEVFTFKITMNLGN